MKTSLLIGNWKMNGSLKPNLELLDVLAKTQDADDCEIVVCPPFPYLLQAATVLSGGRIAHGAQDVSMFQGSGAYTGEVGAAMLADVGCEYVIVGHSERRQLLKETDQMIAQKVKLIMDAGLIPVLCVGETLEERESGMAFDRVLSQVESVISTLNHRREDKFVVAYEPLWAIGTGKVAACTQIHEMHQAIIQYINGMIDFRILYGGSVKPDNTKEIFELDSVDGALVGGASLNASDFLSIFNSLQASHKAI